MLPALDRLPSRPPWLAPPWRLVCSINAPVLRMHTVQADAAYRVLADTGVVHGDPAQAHQDFREAYAWLAAEMEWRLATKGPGMVWAWARISRRDLVRNLRHARGDVLLTVDVPRERVLLHSCSDWHLVLNRGLHLPGQPDESTEEWLRRVEPLIDGFEARVTAAGVRNEPLSGWPSTLRQEIEESWRAIFDPATWEAGAYVQATLHQLRAADVVRAVRIR